MNIVVSNNNVEYTGFVKVAALADVGSVVGSIDCLIYHKSSETSDEAIKYLSKLRESVKKLVYIRNRVSADQAIQMIVVGSGGKYFDDEFFLESPSELSNLVRNLDEVTELAELGQVNVLTDFFNRYLKDGSTGFNKNYLAVVKEAVRGMLTEYRQKDLEMLQLSETATEIFAHSSDIISKMESETALLKSKFEELKNTNLDYSPSNAFSGIPSVVFFPVVSYMKEKKVIRVKDLGSCMYLTSFMLSFRAHLELIKNVRPKLVFIEPVGKNRESKYAKYDWVTQKNARSMSCYGKVVFTNYPTRDVLTKMLDDNGYDTFIIVDRLLNSSKHILNCKGSPVKYAVRGESEVKEFNLNRGNCFSSVRGIDGSLFTIHTFNDYPEDSSNRERMYLNKMWSGYEDLFK